MNRIEKLELTETNHTQELKEIDTNQIGSVYPYRNENSNMKRGRGKDEKTKADGVKNMEEETMKDKFIDVGNESTRQSLERNRQRIIVYIDSNQIDSESSDQSDCSEWEYRPSIRAKTRRKKKTRKRGLIAKDDDKQVRRKKIRNTESDAFGEVNTEQTKESNSEFYSRICTSKSTKYPRIKIKKQMSKIAKPKVNESTSNGNFSWRDEARKLIASIIKHPDSTHFRQEIDYPDNLNKVKNPIDFNTIRQRIMSNFYSNDDFNTFDKDCKKVFSNSKTNNRSKINSMTLRLQNFYEERIDDIRKRYEADKADRVKHGRPSRRVQNQKNYENERPDFGKMFNESSKVPNRRFSTKRILEICSNIDRQRKEIDKILVETKSLVYKFLININAEYEKLLEDLEHTSQLERECRDLEDQY